MSALEAAVQTAIKNVLTHFAEKYLGEALPAAVEQMKAMQAKVDTFDERLTSVQQGIQEILYRMNLQATGGPSLAEMITFGSENVIHETAEGVDKGASPIIDLEAMRQQFRSLENDGSNGNRDAASGPGNDSGDAA